MNFSSTFYFLEKIKENNFLIIGRAGIDIYPDPPGMKTENANHFVTHLGGSSANISVALTKLGGKCKLLTSVSDDALGRLAINQLKTYSSPPPFLSSAHLRLSTQSKIKKDSIFSSAANFKVNFKGGGVEIEKI